MLERDKKFDCSYRIYKKRNLANSNEIYFVFKHKISKFRYPIFIHSPMVRFETWIQLLFMAQNADKQTNLESQEDLNDPHSIVMNAKKNKNK